MSNRIFKYYPSDFGTHPVRVLHMDLDFDVYDAYTSVRSRLKLKATRKLKALELNAKNLELKSVVCREYPLTWVYEKDTDKIVITFGKEILRGKEFVIESENITRPTSNILEGLYYDRTPEGAPPTQITQCQQWGFQRLVPCIDDMTAKCTYITSITADSRYTSMITNGDVKVKRKTVAPGRDRIVYGNTLTPMAPYLFFLGVGTYDTFSQEFEYPDGRKFMLELLVQPGSDREAAERALSVLNEGIMWIYLFTGQEMYAKHDTRERMWALYLERERLRKAGDSARLSKVRDELSSHLKKIKPGYQYTGTVYREIAMQNSNFGGMENVGNTTVTANRIMPYADMTDPGFEYMIRVKLHEFYHNINGSEVTGMSPFEIWLNEAVTVIMEKEYHAFLFGMDYSRLSTVLTLLSPEGGTFSEDENAASMPVEPDGFNDPSELITGVTYVKAPEFVRMIRILAGDETFAKGLYDYHRKFAHGNARRTDWLSAMEKASGLDFRSMAESYLKNTGFPVVSVKSRYDGKKLTLSLEQTNQKAQWQFPFIVAAVDRNGNDLAEKMKWVKKDEDEISMSTEKPAFLSLNRGYSFYGKVSYDAPAAELYLQARKDPDTINRYMAFYRLMNAEMTRLVKNTDAEPDHKLISLYFEMLSDTSLVERMGALMNTVFEAVEDRRLSHKYKELYAARKRFLKAVARSNKEELMHLYSIYSNTITGDYLAKQIYDIKHRQAKNLVLGLLANLDTPDVQAMAKQQFESADNATDRISAFAKYINTSAPDKLDFIKAFMASARENPVRWEMFLSAIGSNDSDDALGIIRMVESSPDFRIDQANDQRALFVRFSMNRRKSLQTEEGRDFLRATIIRLAKVNEYNTVHMLQELGNIDDMDPEYHVPLIQLLADVLGSLRQDEVPSVYNTTKRILKNSPLAAKAYEKTGKAIP